MICSCIFSLMIRRPPRSTRTDTLFPYTTLFRSVYQSTSALNVTTSSRAGSLPHLIPVTINPKSWPSADPTHARSTRSEEHTSELQSLMRISYAVFCLKKKKQQTNHRIRQRITNKQNNTPTKDSQKASTLLN